MALLDLIQDVALGCNYPQPTAAFASTDTNIQLMVKMAQDTGDEMVERWDWQSLKIQAPVTFTGDGSTPVFTLPAPFTRLGPSDTFVSSLYPTLRLTGPLNEEDLLRMKALPMSIATHVWREVDGEIEFYPVLASGETISFVYQQGLWITNSTGGQYALANGQDTPRFQADTDRMLIPQRVVKLGAIYRWKRAKGLEYSSNWDEYEAALNRKSGQETTGRTIQMSDDMGPVDTWPGIVYDYTDQNF